MNPNAALARIRHLAAAVTRSDATLSDVDELGCAVRDLDDWLTRGGFLPEAWRDAHGRGALDRPA